MSAWAAAWLVLTAELYMVVNSDNSAAVPLRPIAIGQLIRVLLWMPATFFVVWAFRRWPLSGPHALRSCLWHIGLSLGSMLMIHVLRVLFITGLYQDWDLHWFHAVVLSSFNGLRVTDISIYWAIVGILAIKDYSQREHVLEAGRERLQSSLAEAELRALKYQLKPHFVFNSLNAISALIREERYAKAIDTLADLSVLMRTMSDAPTQERITLEMEVDFIQRLLAIERVRFGEKLQVEIDVGEGTGRALVPSFLLQPLVENAIKHGISRRIRPGRLLVRAELTGDRRQLRLEVRNDGPTPNGAPRAAGVGLTATRERLRLLYGSEFELHLDLARETDVSAVIVIPFHQAADALHPNPAPL